MYSNGADILHACSGDIEAIDFRGGVRRIWHQKREELEQLSPSIAPHRQTIIDLWTGFGKKCDIDVDAPYDPNAEVEEAAARRSGQTKRCAWRECLCFGERPQHNLKICKRCTKVLYCSSKCQRRCVSIPRWVGHKTGMVLNIAPRDWNDGGHKYICRLSD